MSLIILSNSQEEYSTTNAAGQRLNTQTGIQEPAFFRNHLVNSLKIPRNAEVAVQSVKINRLPVFNIKNTDLFHFYLGVGLRTNADVAQYSINQTGEIPIPIRFNEGTYNVRQMSDELQRALRIGISHPYYFNKVIVAPKYDTGGDWEGFSFTTDVVTKNAGTDHAKEMSTWKAGNSLSNKANFTFTTVGTTKVIENVLERDTMEESYVVNTDCPINQMNGSMEFNFFDDDGADMGVSYSVSLSRPEADSQLNPFSGNPDLGGAFLPVDLPADVDYCLSWAKNPGDRRALILSARTRVGNELVMNEIEYWLAVPGGDDGITNPVTAQILQDNIRTGDGTGYFGEFKWEVIGNAQRLYMRYNVAAVIDPATPAVLSWRLIHDSTTAPNRLVNKALFPPINQNKWALYVGASVRELNKTITFTAQNWNNELNGKYDYNTSSWWSQCNFNNGNNLSNMILAQNIEMRTNQELDELDLVTRLWVGQDASRFSPAYTQAIVLTESPGCKTSDSGVYCPAVNANMGKQLGFGELSYLQSGINGTTYLSAQDAATEQANPAPRWVVAGFETPEFNADTLFVKLPNLTCQSYNFCKSAPSQILYHLPRFTNAGKTYGELFYEVPEKTYVSLGNTEELNINELDVALVNKNERVVKDLTGSTTIVIHIRHR